MKILTVFGTRPEIIRLSAVIRHLDRAGEHTLVHTGQNYDELLSDIFFRELGVRQPDRHLGIRSARFADQVAGIIAAAGSLFEEVRPDRVLVLDGGRVVESGAHGALMAAGGIYRRLVERQLLKA